MMMQAAQTEGKGFIDKVETSAEEREDSLREESGTSEGY